MSHLLYQEIARRCPAFHQIVGLDIIEGDNCYLAVLETARVPQSPSDKLEFHELQFYVSPSLSVSLVSSTL